MDATSAVRSFFAHIDILLAQIIEKLYNLIFDIATVDSIFKVIEDMVNKVYIVVGLFMLFKLALTVINYVINPDYLTSQEKGVSKLVQKIVISLALLSFFPTIFREMYNIQSIVLKENIIGKIVLGGQMDEDEIKNSGKMVSYYVVSNFLDYNRTGDLSAVFPSDCPNIFVEGDFTKGTVPLGTKYCGLCGVSVKANKCANFLTPYIESAPSYISNKCFKAMNDKNIVACNDYWKKDSREEYYLCKSGKRGTTYPTVNCGVRNGLDIVALINSGQQTYDVSKILSNEVLAAVESDPLFIMNYCPNTLASCSYDPSIANEDVDSVGDYIFEYKIPYSSICLILIVVMLSIISIDIAIRSVKLSFLQVIAPIPIISNIDINGSNLFKKWIKLVVGTYLELFVKLASVFITLFVIIMVMDGRFSSLDIIKGNIMAKMIFIIGAIFFALKFPKLLSQIFNFNTDGGLMSVIRGASNFLLGAGAMAVSGAGGFISNAAAGVENMKDANGFKNKASAFGKGVLSSFAGGSSAATRTLGRQIKNKGKVGLHDIKAGIHGSVNARFENASGRHLGVRFMDELRDLSQINPREHLDSATIQKRIDSLKESQTKNDELIKNLLVNNSHSAQIKEAFRVDSDGNRVYSDYDAYNNVHASELSQTEYESMANLFDERDDIARQIKEYTEKYERELSNEAFNKSNKDN